MSRTFNTIKDLKEFMGTLSISQIKTSTIRKSIAGNYTILYS